MDYDVDVAIVGGGLAGISAAITAAKNGLSVIVLERGERSGSKNVSGGRMYVHSLKKLLGDRFKDAPLELPIKKETFEIYTGNKKINFSFENQDSENSYSILRSKFDAWFASEAENLGVPVSYSTLVSGIDREESGLTVRSDRGDIKTPLVIESDGAAAFASRYLGIKKEKKFKMQPVKNLHGNPDFMPEQFMVGVKEIVDKKPEYDYGEAKTILGLSDGIKGGGFSYTNKETTSIGLTLKLDSLEGNKEKAFEIIEDFRDKLGIEGKLLEYSAHMIPFYRFDTLPQRYAENLLVTGDAAGFLINDGFTIRGMDNAIESGRLAGEAAKKIKDSGDYSDTFIYEQMLEDSFILKDMQASSRISSLFGNERTFDAYPKMMANILERMFTVTENPRENIKNVMMDEVKKNNIGYYTLLQDMLKVI
ncbi:FAD-dependent oxidoreductase [Ferroplasma sp.]|uniref:FAD-dependent oxidoreductase n=1 Tax=Ferroplasma sp. TaxID=2591003 RepID=UPI00307D3EDB